MVVCLSWDTFIDKGEGPVHIGKVISVFKRRSMFIKTHLYPLLLFCVLLSKREFTIKVNEHRGVF